MFFLAVTLKHLVSNRRSSSFTLSCSRCGLHFTSTEHLEMHETMSTCNPDMVWPHNSSTVAGLKAIHRSELDASAVEDTRSKATSTAPALSASLDRTTATLRSASASSTPRTRSAIGTQPAGRVKVEGVRAEKSESTPKSPGNSAAEMKKRLFEAIMQDLEDARAKKVRKIVPEGKVHIYLWNHSITNDYVIDCCMDNGIERQAFFAVVSHLIDFANLSPDIQITDENYENFIPERHRALVEKLKRYTS